MSFCTFSKENTSQGKLLIDNLFITNYLPEAPDNALKVYLYGLYLCQNSTISTVNEMANLLGMDVEEVKDFFKYWEEYGLLSIISYDPFTVTYYSTSSISTSYKRFKPEKYEDFTKAVQSVINGRMISVTEFNEYFQLLESTALKVEALLMICKYCVDLKGNEISYKYIVTVAKDFINRGITTPELVEKELSAYFSTTKEVAEVFRALKSSKTPDVEDIQAYKKWISKYCFMHEYVLSIIKLSKAKNIKKLDKTIDELYSNKCFTEEDAKEYFKNKEKLYNIATEVNKTLGIYIDVLDNVIISYTSPWTAMGYDEETLIFIANYCFRKNKRSLELMDETVKKLYSLGLITTENIAVYIKNFSDNDKFISNILEIVGASRKPTDWDRENVKLWRSWNFTDDAILEAAKRASGVRNFIPYVTTILADWKNKNAFTIEEISKLKTATTLNKGVNHFDNERKLSKDELNKLVDSFDDFEV